MNKVVNYLNEHLQGEVLDSPNIRAQYAVDGSILTIQPEMVAFVRTTSDIRKIARFAWQLAEKGHSMPLTVRGSGGAQLSWVGRCPIQSARRDLPRYDHLVIV